MSTKFCPECGSPLDPGAKYCGSCGAACTSRPGMDSKPITRAEAKKIPHKSCKTKEPKKTGIGWRIFFFILAVIFLYMGTSAFVVGFFGNWSVPENATFDFNKHSVNGNRNDYDWWINYDFFVEEDGQTYRSFSYWKGNYTTPNSGYKKYYVNYLPVYPEINRLSKCKPVIRCGNVGDAIESGFMTILGALIQYAAMYLMLVLAGVPVPRIFGRKKRKKKKAKA